MEKEKDFILSRDGKPLFTGTHNECFEKLLGIQSQSTQWAMKYEGYKIKKNQEGE